MPEQSSVREDFCRATDATIFFPAAGGKNFFIQKCGIAGEGILAAASLARANRLKKNSAQKKSYMPFTLK
jgi:hypothetical protein